MKKTKYIVLLTWFLTIITVSCEIDNYEEPNATISGKFLDSETGELVGTDIVDGNSIGVYELGWETEARQSWSIMNSGEYVNNLVFAAAYRIEFTNCNFYPFVVDDFIVKKGSNTYDFTVSPYIRVINPSITYDAATQTVNAAFNLEAGGNDVNLREIRLFAFSDQWVGNYVKFAIDGADCYKKVSAGAIDAVIDEALRYTLSIDVSAYPGMFKYTRNYYFRIGALASVPGVGTVRYNYSPLVVLNIER